MNVSAVVRMCECKKKKKILSLFTEETYWFVGVQAFGYAHLIVADGILLVQHSP